MRYLPLIIASLVLTASLPAQEKKDGFPPIPTIDLKLKNPVEYGADVEPIFRAKCFVCHTGNVTEGAFDMSAYEKVMKGGKKCGAKVIVPGKSADSFLFLACSRQTRPMMPPKSEEPLTSREVSMIKAWIDEGRRPRPRRGPRKRSSSTCRRCWSSRCGPSPLRPTARRSSPAAATRFTCSS